MKPKLRVLVVEDNADDYDLLIHALMRGGFEIDAERVSTDAEMQAAVASHSWDLICVDWILPQFSAPAALRILRDAGVTAPCIVVSGFPGEEIAVLAVKIGASDFMRKDQMMDLLPLTVRRELLLGSH